MELPKEFNLEYQWKFFCDKIGLPEERMHPDQKREMKRACSQMLLLYKEDLGNYADQNGPQGAVMVLANLLEQANDYWGKEMKEQTAKNNSKTIQKT